MDYVFAMDIDVAFVSYVGREILAETVGTLHADNAFYDGSEVVSPRLPRLSLALSLPPCPPPSLCLPPSSPPPPLSLNLCVRAYGWMDGYM